METCDWIDKLSENSQTKIEQRLGFRLSKKTYAAALMAYRVCYEDALEAMRTSMDDPWRQLSQFERAMSSNNPAIKSFVDGKITWHEMYGAKLVVTGAHHTRSQIDPSSFGKNYRFSDLKHHFTKSQAPALIFAEEFVPGEKTPEEK